MAVSRWYDRKVREAKLTLMNDAGAWKKIVDMAVSQFNSLGFQVTIGPSDSVTGADIVARFSMGSGPDKNFSWAVANFDAEVTHGQTAAHIDDRGKMDKAVIFLPGKLKHIKDDLKVIVAVHELIHACGLTDHDPNEGIMYAKLQELNGKLIWPQEDTSHLQSMPPIKIGGWTRCQMNFLWNGQACENN